VAPDIRKSTGALLLFAVMPQSVKQYQVLHTHKHTQNTHTHTHIHTHTHTHTHTTHVHTHCQVLYDCVFDHLEAQGCFDGIILLYSYAAVYVRY
jgi:hypothetical protein